jgi:hypothetical protein
MSSLSANGRGNGTSLMHLVRGRGARAGMGKETGEPGVDVIVREQM